MILKSGDTTKKIAVLMVDSTDFTTAETGLTLTVTKSKNGGSYAAWSGTSAEVANGVYALTPASGDVDTNGSLAIHVTGTGAAPADILCQVVAFDPYAAADLGLTAVPIKLAQTISVSPTNGTVGEALAAGRASSMGKRSWDASGNEVIKAHDDSTTLVTHVIKDRAGSTLAAPATGQPTQRT